MTDQTPIDAAAASPALSPVRPSDFARDPRVVAKERAELEMMFGGGPRWLTRTINTLGLALLSLAAAAGFVLAVLNA